MSKKCCGIIYSDDEAVCKICGESLENAEIVQEESVINDSEPIQEETEINNELKEKTKEEIKEDSKEKIKEEVKEEVKEEKKETSTFVFEDDDEENKASVGHKVFGVISILLVLTVFAMIGLCVYFLIISPFYAKDASDTPSVYPEISTVTDASITGIRETVPYTEVSTSTDADIASSATEDTSKVNEDADVATIGDATEPVIEDNSNENVEE